MSPEVWISLIAVLGTLGGSLGSAVLTNRSARAREAERWQRETQEQRRQERLAICEDLASHALLLSHGRELDKGTITKSLTRLQLRMSTETSDAASELISTCRKVAKLYEVSPNDREAINAALDEVASMRANFLEVARKESDPENVSTPNK